MTVDDSEAPSKTPQNRRRLFPNQVLLLPCAAFLCGTIGFLFLFNEWTPPTAQIQPGDGFLWVHAVSLLGLGVLLFDLVRQFFDLKFIQFLSRVDADLWNRSPDLQLLRFRKSGITPWILRELNAILQYAAIPLVQTRRLLAEIEEELEEEHLCNKLDRERLILRLLEMEDRLNFNIEVEAGRRQRPPGVLELLTLKRTALWAGIYVAAVLVLWVLLPFWMAESLGSLVNGAFLSFWLLLNGFAAYSCLIAAFAYLWTTSQHLRFIQHVNECCRHYLRSRDVHAIKTNPRRAYGFFLTTLKFFVMRNEERRADLMERIARMKRMLNDDKIVFGYEELKSVL